MQEIGFAEPEGAPQVALALDTIQSELGLGVAASQKALENRCLDAVGEACGQAPGVVEAPFAQPFAVGRDGNQAVEAPVELLVVESRRRQFRQRLGQAPITLKLVLVKNASQGALIGPPRPRSIESGRSSPAFVAEREFEADVARHLISANRAERAAQPLQALAAANAKRAEVVVEDP